MHGLLPFLKPPGLTSHDAVNFARRVLGTKRVGHGGTLDPAAAGVLPLGIGEGARLLPWLPGDKEYIAELQFGWETDTLDGVGQIVSRGDAKEVTTAHIEALLPRFHGTFQQVPPLYSAIKTDGVKGYERARAGEDVELPSREVTVHSLELLRFDAGSARAHLRVSCGAGFYVRSLVRDIGRELGCGATMTFLVRTVACGFRIEAAATAEELASPDQPSGFIHFAAALAHCATTRVEDDALLADYLAGRSCWREAAAHHAQSDSLLVSSGIQNAADQRAMLLYDENRSAFFWTP
jgi:tRNA pseudouridine55 synthase